MVTCLPEIDQACLPRGMEDLVTTTESTTGPWDSWPAVSHVTIPVLGDWPCYSTSDGLEPGDARWKDRMVSAMLAGRMPSPPGSRARKEILGAINEVCFRTYHVARMVQAHFRNPAHGNLEDPFLETIFIMLSWRTSIRKAAEDLNAIVTGFRSPREMLEPGGLHRLERILGGSGFTAKRPAMVLHLVRAFIEKFPDGDVSAMREWKDDDVITFLDNIPGVGRKSALCVLMYSLGRPCFPVDAHVGRILKRTQMLRELVTIPDGVEHRPLQLEAEQYVPPSVRAALHAGLVSLGQEYCGKKPRCTECPIHHICAHYAACERERAEGKPYTHVDLFCGAGGFSAGFCREGFRTLLAVDKEGGACRTFIMNHPEMPPGNVQACDLATSSPRSIIERCGGWREDLVPGRVDVLTAGIPCQGFSKAGYRSRPARKYDPHADPRNHLYRPVIEWIKLLQPRYVVIENVREIMSAGSEKSKILDAICRALEKAGYSVDFGVINAADFGVPQVRYRLILIASHQNIIPVKVEELERYHTDRMTLGQAINNLPPIGADGGSWYMSTRDGVITSHRARYNNEDDLRIFEAINPGEHYERFVERCPGIIRERQNADRAIYDTKSFSDKFYKLDSDEPSRTIVSHLEKDGNGYIHPDQVRSITPREAMRLQGFEDDFIFCGSRKAQYVQAGNAVPPPLVRVVARVIKRSLRRTGGDE